MCLTHWRIPVLELYNSAGELIGTNDNWRENANEQEVIDTGPAPLSEDESVLLVRLPSDDTGVAYTALLRGANDMTGVSLLEIYDLDSGTGPNILNISTRGKVDQGGNVLISGLIVRGSNAQKVLIRALGPSLPVDGSLADPTLELFDENGARLRSNDNWRSDQPAEIIGTSIPPPNESEAAIVATLAPAAYTVIVCGAAETSGIALVEIYALN